MFSLHCLRASSPKEKDSQKSVQMDVGMGVGVGDIVGIGSNSGKRVGKISQTEVQLLEGKGRKDRNEGPGASCSYSL